MTAAQEPANIEDRPYIVSETPLSNRHFRLLHENKFVLQNDGTVLDPVSGKPVRRAEMAYLVHRLESAQRLKTLLTLNLILNKSQGEKNLTDEERQAIRKIVRENWTVLSFGTRKDFKGYFSLQEQEQLEKDLPDADVSALSMKDPISAAQAPTEVPNAVPIAPPVAALVASPEPAPVAAPAAAPAAAPTAAPVAAAAQPELLTDMVFPSVLMPHRLIPTPSHPAPAAAAGAAPEAAPVPSTPAAAPMSPPMDAAALVAAALVAAPAAAPPQAAPAEALGTLLPWDPNRRPAVAESSAPVATAALTPPPVVQAGDFFFGKAPTVLLPPPQAPAAEAAPAPPAAAEPAPAVAPALPAPAPEPPRPAPGLGEVTAAELEKFLVEGPYGRDAKAMLRLIEAHAPAAARTRALNTLRFAVPQVSLDATRAGGALRSALVYGAPGQSPTIVLRPAVVLQTRKSLFFGETETLLSDSAKNFEETGLPAPALAALSREAPSREEATAWGTIRVFADGSRRAGFSLEQQAGLLLAELLRLDIRLRGQDASEYDTEVYARTAQLLFYARLQSALTSDRFLDPELRQDLRLWLAHPAEYRNNLVHGLSAGRSGRLDPRRAGAEAHADFNRRVLASCQQAQADERTRAAAASRASALQDLAAYEATGLFEGSRLEEARARLTGAFEPAALSDCDPRWDEELARLPKSSLMAAEMLAAERKFREDREGGDAK